MQTTPLRALERFVHREGGSPNSAVEAGSRLLQYVVDQVAEDTSHSSTVALPLQLLFPLIGDFSSEFFANRVTQANTTRYLLANILSHHFDCLGVESLNE